jgi:hypothetical protein
LATRGPKPKTQKVLSLLDHLHIFIISISNNNNNNNNNEIYIALNPNTRFTQSASHGSILSRKGSPEKMRLQERLEGRRDLKAT